MNNNTVAKGHQVFNYNSMRVGKNYILVEREGDDVFEDKVTYIGKSTSGQQYGFKESVGTARYLTADKLNEIEVYSTNMRHNRPGKKTRKSRGNNRRNLTRRRR
jgi:hypothetical protein